MTLSLAVLADPRPHTPHRLAPGVTDVRRPTTSPFTELSELGRAAEAAGLDAVVVPADPDGVDPLVAAADLLRHSRHLRVVAEVAPEIATPVYAAKLSVSLQRFHAGRLDWLLRPDAWPAPASRLEEWVDVARAVWTGTGVTIDGVHHGVLDGGFGGALAGEPLPRLHVVRGTRDDAATAPDGTDVLHVPLDGGLEDASRSLGGSVLGVEVEVVARPTAAQAHRDADRLGVDTATGALVGSWDDVAAGLDALHQRGAGHVTIVPAEPVADVYRLGEHVLPLLAPAGDRHLEVARG